MVDERVTFTATLWVRPGPNRYELVDERWFKWFRRWRAKRKYKGFREAYEIFGRDYDFSKLKVVSSVEVNERSKSDMENKNREETT